MYSEWLMSFHRLGYKLETIVDNIFVKHQRHSEIRNICRLLDTTGFISIIKNKQKQTNKQKKNKTQNTEQ